MNGAVLTAIIGGAALILAPIGSALVSWLTGRQSRRAERARDTIADRDTLIDQLQEDVAALRKERTEDRARIDALEQARAEDRRRIETLEQERRQDRAMLDVAREHIAALEDLVPVPPGAPPRPAGL